MATVLIVEDQTQILALAQSRLEEEGYKTLTARSADDALVILAGPEPVDALFVDIILNRDMQASGAAQHVTWTGKGSLAASPVVLGDMMVMHTFTGSCRGGPLDGQSLEHHQNVYRIFEPPSYELLGEYWHQDGKWVWRPSSNRTNDVK